MTFEEELMEAIDGFKCGITEFEHTPDGLKFTMEMPIEHYIMPVIEKWCFRKPLTKDGEIIRRGKTYYGGDGRAWKVDEIINACKPDAHCIRACNHGIMRELKPEWLTTTPPVIAADGVVINEGDELWPIYDSECIMCGRDTSKPIRYVFESRFGMEKFSYINKEGVECTGYTDFTNVTHERPDSLERIREDMMGGLTDYWKCRGHSCSECPSKIDGETPAERYGTHGSCTEAMMLDVIDRTVKVMERGK